MHIHFWLVPSSIFLVRLAIISFLIFLREWTMCLVRKKKHVKWTNCTVAFFWGEIHWRIGVSYEFLHLWTHQSIIELHCSGGTTTENEQLTPAQEGPIQLKRKLSKRTPPPFYPHTAVMAYGSLLTGDLQPTNLLIAEILNVLHPSTHPGQACRPCTIGP